MVVIIFIRSLIIRIINKLSILISNIGKITSIASTLSNINTWFSTP